MNWRVYIVATCAGALLLAAGCSRTDTTAGKTATPATQPAPSAPATTATPPPSPPPPPMPPPDAPKGEASAGPKPGQANDHSSPAFKAGGKGQDSPK
jgi:hypothetical protein